MIAQCKSGPETLFSTVAIGPDAKCFCILPSQLELEEYQSQRSVLPPQARIRGLLWLASPSFLNNDRRN
jgi:hypothetical protein